MEGWSYRTSTSNHMNCSSSTTTTTTASCRTVSLPQQPAVTLQVMDSAAPSSTTNVSHQPRPLQGPRPAPLRVRKESRKIKKAPPSAALPPAPPPPVIIYTVSPKVIQTSPGSFMSLVQRLTGKKYSSPPAAALSPAAQLAAIEKARRLVGDDSRWRSAMSVLSPDQLELDLTRLGGGVLSPNPASLPPIPCSLFSSGTELSSVGFSISPAAVMGSGRSYADGSFLLSPLNMSLTPNPAAWDAFNLFCL